MPLTSVRVDADLLKQAKQLGINVSEAARAGIREAIRRQRILDNIDWAEKNAVPTDEPSEVIVRRMRDERSAYIHSRGKTGNRDA